jgi:hypothetical protein
LRSIFRLSISLLLLTAAPAFGAAQVDTLNIDGDGTTIAWTNVSCTNDWECIDEGFPPNDGTDYVETNSTTPLQHEGTVSWSPTDFDAVDSIIIVVRHMETGGGTKVVDYGLSSNGTDDEADQLSDASGVWTTFRGADKHTTNPDGGGAWTEAAVDAMQISFTNVSGQTPAQGNRRSQITSSIAIVYWQDTGAGPSTKSQVMRTVFSD